MNIALVQIGRIGDMVLTTSVISAIKEHFPDSNLYIIAGRTNSQVLAGNPYIEEVLVYDKKPFKLLQFIRKLRSIRFDYYIDPKDHFSKESYYLAKIANADVKIGFNDLKHNAFDLYIPSAMENNNLHFVERLFIALQPLGIKLPALYQPLIYLSNKECEYANKYLTDNDIDKFIFINISAGKDERMWLNDKWVELIKAIYSQTNIKIILVSEKRHLQSAEYICNKTGVLHFLPTSLMNIVALLKQSKLVITPDTSLVHFAAAFDIPVISMTGNYPNNIINFFPLSRQRQVIISVDANNKNVSGIAVDAVLEAYNELTNKIFNEHP